MDTCGGAAGRLVRHVRKNPTGQLCSIRDERLRVDDQVRSLHLAFVHGMANDVCSRPVRPLRLIAAFGMGAAATPVSAQAERKVSLYWIRSPRCLTNRDQRSMMTRREALG